MTNQSRPREAEPGVPGATGDPAEARRVRLTAIWAIVLRRFRDHTEEDA